MRRFLLAALLIACAVCGAPQTAANKTATAGTATDFEKLTDDFLYGSLALSPVAATQAGYHQHNGVPLDEQLDDFSAAGVDAQRKFYDGLKTRIDLLNTSSLDKEQ